MNARIAEKFFSMVGLGVAKPLSESEKELRDHARIVAKRFENYAKHGDKYALAHWVKKILTASLLEQKEKQERLLHRKLVEYTWDYVLGHQTGEATLRLAFRARGEAVPADSTPSALRNQLGLGIKGPIPDPLTLVARVYCALADGLRDAPTPPGNQVRDPLRAKLIDGCPIDYKRLNLPPLSAEELSAANALLHSIQTGEVDAETMSSQQHQLFCRAVIDPSYRNPARANLTKKT